MGRNSDFQFSGWLYKLGASILFVLSVVALIAFIKALSVTEHEVEKRMVAPADSIQVEIMRREVRDLNKKVDSLINLTQKELQEANKK